jgi:hypothetical protein
MGGKVGSWGGLGEMGHCQIQFGAGGSGLRCTSSHTEQNNSLGILWKVMEHLFKEQ